ncbi:twin-arginine translocation signal domain-containing protein [bacterium]|nr:twin-arginine translocation signal domain-containing protein [bacterium]
MNEEAKQNLSRRDILKVLGAASGAAVLANLPAKWSSPELAVGVLPAHAQTSVCYALTIELVDTDGIAKYESYQIPPDEEDGAFLRWYCQEGCADLDIWSEGDGATFITVRVTTTAGTFEHTEYAGEGGPYFPLLVDLATGAYSMNFNLTVGSCGWAGDTIGDKKSNRIGPRTSEGTSWGA